MSISKCKNTKSDNYELTVKFGKKRVRKTSHDRAYLLDLQEKLLKLRADNGTVEEGRLLVAAHPSPLKELFKMSLVWDRKHILQESNNLLYIQDLRNVLLELRSNGGSYEQALQLLDEYQTFFNNAPTTEIMDEKEPLEENEPTSESLPEPAAELPPEPPLEQPQMLFQDSENYYVGFIKDKDDSWCLTVGKVFDRNRVSKRHTDNTFLSELLDKVMEVKRNGGSFEEVKELINSTPNPIKKPAPPFNPDTAIITVEPAKESDKICLCIRKSLRDGGHGEPYPLRQGIYFLFHFGEQLVFIDQFDLLGDRTDTNPVRPRTEAIPVRLVRYKNKSAWIQSNRPIPDHPYWQEIKHFYPAIDSE